MSQGTIVIGSRGSDLALWQANWVQAQLRLAHPDLEVPIKIIKTKGDKILDSPLSKIGDKGLFTREIENELLDGDIDLAVHSLKDLPTQLPDGLTIGAITEREDVRDAFIPHPTNSIASLWEQSQGARIATGSLRRKSQILSIRPDFEMIDIRGNLNTRMKKLEESDWAGMILAAAGVKRLGWVSKIGEHLDTGKILPAVGQGALGIEIRAHDERVATIVRGLHHKATAAGTLAERSLLRRLEGGCQVPIGAHGVSSFEEISGKEILTLTAFVGSLDGSESLRDLITGETEEAEALGIRLAELLRSKGADRILAGIRGPLAQEEKKS